jgi:hypothetical protein
MYFYAFKLDDSMEDRVTSQFCSKNEAKLAVHYLKQK